MIHSQTVANHMHMGQQRQAYAPKWLAYAAVCYRQTAAAYGTGIALAYRANSSGQCVPRGNV